MNITRQNITTTTKISTSKLPLGSSIKNLFAYSSFVIKTDLKEFSFVSNIPKINNHIEVGEPICTINSISDDEKKAKKLLLDNISLVKDKLITAEII